VAHDWLIGSSPLKDIMVDRNIVACISSELLHKYVTGNISSASQNGTAGRTEYFRYVAEIARPIFRLSREWIMYATV
jgi:hypothetical protein